MRRKSGASEPCSKAESGSQTAYNKRIAGLSATAPEVQIPGRGWNAADCKCAPGVLLAGVSTKHATEQSRHLNRNQTQTNCRNTLRNFPLHGFNEHLHRFRCSGKGKHLNLAQTHNSEANQLTANALQDFRKLHPRFRCQTGLEQHRMQIHSGGASGWGIRQTRSRTAHASEPEQNSKNLPQFIEKLFIAWFWQASPLVQMQRKRGVSEPCSKAGSGGQAAHNKRVARLSATVPVVQIPDGFGTPQNANVHWKHF